MATVVPAGFRLAALTGLIERIYAAATNPALWPEVLTDVGRAVSEGTQTLLFLPGREHLPNVLRCERTPDSVLFPFLEYYSSVNVLSDPCDRIFPEGAVRFSHVAVADPDFERSEFYADFFRRNHLFYSCGIKQSEAGGGMSYLSLQREKALQAFCEQETAVLELLMPHLRRALSMQARLMAQSHRVHTAETALAAFGKAVVAIDAAGRFSFATAAAEVLLASDGPLRVRCGRLHAREPHIDDQLQKRLRSVLDMSTGFARSRGEALLVPLRSTSGRSKSFPHRPMDIASSYKLVFLPMRHTCLPPPMPPGALVSISGGMIEDESTPRMHAILRDLFGLTPVEARIAALIDRGAEVKSIALTIQKSEAATRFHLKQIFGKTGTSRQGDLLRVLAALPKL